MQGRRSAVIEPTIPDPNGPEQVGNDPHLLILSIEQIRLDGGTQNRRSLDQSVINTYAKLMSEETAFPPVNVWFDGTFYWLSDGFHRIEAAKTAGFRYVSARVENGSVEDARWDSYAANATHGLPRKKGDLIAILRRALQHPNASQMTNVQMAEHLGLPETTLRRWRGRLSSATGDDTASRVVTRNGRTYTMRLHAREVSRVITLRKTNAQLRDALAKMQVGAPPITTEVLKTLEAWIFCRIDDDGFLGTINAILSPKTTVSSVTTLSSR